MVSNAMRLLALITARGGSKRVPGKNIRLLGGKPLIVWSIDVAKGVPDICDILVSTDDPAIAEVCLENGALVPWLRPAELATDTANSVDVALHALDWYESEKGEVDGVILLQPTSPFRTKETVLKGIGLFAKNTLVPVLGVSLARTHPMWALKKQGGDRLEPYLEGHGFGKRSQDLPDAFAANGCFYLISPKLLRSNKSFVGATVQPLLVDSIAESTDIDTEEDWVLAESLLNKNGSSYLKSEGMKNKFNAVTAAYISENEAAFSVEQRTLVYAGRPRKVVIESLQNIAKLKLENATLGMARYLRGLIHGWDDIKKLSATKGSKKGKKALVIGNGPSQGLVNSQLLQKFINGGNDIFAVNFWPQNAEISSVSPQYLIISDPSTLTDSGGTDSYSEYLGNASKVLKAYLLERESIVLISPIDRVRHLKGIFGAHRVLGFIDTEMRWLTANIDPRLPRGYLSMTLFKALAFAIHLGYDQVYLIGMDNTYPRDIFCDKANRILNYERHAAAADYLIDVSSHIPTMDIWAQDIFQLFHDLRRCFSGSQVMNLDCYSLTDVFPKVSDFNEIEKLLSKTN